MEQLPNRSVTLHSIQTERILNKSAIQPSIQMERILNKSVTPHFIQMELLPNKLVTVPFIQMERLARQLEIKDSVINVFELQTTQKDHFGGLFSCHSIQSRYLPLSEQSFLKGKS
jgi:hypothetical protein